jgi:hypothetical protein
MTQPDGFIVKGQEDNMCKLQKSLYVLKQALKQWHKKFDLPLMSAGFIFNEVDQCVLMWGSGSYIVLVCR